MSWMTEMIIIITVEVLKRSIIPMEAMASESSLYCQLGNSITLKKITTMEKVWIDFDDFTFPFTP